MKIKILVCCLCLGMANISFAQKQIPIHNQSSELVILSQPLENQTITNLDTKENLTLHKNEETQSINPLQLQMLDVTQTQNVEALTEIKEQPVIEANESMEPSEPCLALQQGFDISYNGACHKGLPNGYGIAKGNLGTYKGNFTNGLFDGQGILDTYVVSDAYEGSFKLGKKDGQGYIYDRLSRENRLAEFENDKFIAWLDNIEASLSHERNINGVSATTTNNTPTYDKKLQVGQQTTYGKIIGIDGQIVTVEKFSYDKEGYQRLEIHTYPISLFRH